jgi:uncharacterized protein YneF (UPF0154 family)
MSDVLETPRLTDPSDVPFINTAVRYGIIGGLIFIIYGMIGNLTGLNRPSAGFGAIGLNFLISIGLYVGIMVAAVKKHRDAELGGYIPFGRAFMVGLVVAVIAGILGGIFNFIYMSYIEPDFMETMIAETQAMYERMGMSETQIEKAMEQVKSSFEPSKMLIQGFVWSAILGGIVSLIVAAIMKKNPPESL